MVTANLEVAEMTTAGASRQMRNAIIASVLGWSLDLFDLFILLYVAPVIGALFFPSSIPTLSLAAVYASFAVTLLMRPVGSAIFGHYADIRGRKNAMLVAIVGVGITTAAFGLLPTIARAGIVAPLLFLVLRLVQGVFVGGVVASTHTVGTESVSPAWRGSISGFIGGGGAAIGALLASFVFLITSSIFPGDAFAVWGWRCMFFAGLLSSLLGWFVFQSLEESPFFKEHLRRTAVGTIAATRSPLKTLFSSRYRGILSLNLLLTFGGGAGYYLTSGYLPSFLKLVNGVPNSTASLILMAGSVAALISAVLFGALSDLIGRKKTFLLVGVCMMVLLPVCYLGMAKAADTTAIALYAIAIAFLGNAGYAPILIFLNERFPTEIRASGTGLSWNIGFALGGMMPTFVSLASAGAAQIPMALSVFVVVIFAIYLTGVVLIPETKGDFRGHRARRPPERSPRSRGRTISFELDRLVLSGFVKRGSPDLVRRLVFAAAKTESGSKTEVHVAGIFQDVDQLLGVELRPDGLQRLDQDVCRDVAFERHVVRRLARVIFGESILVFENDARVAGNRRHHLRHDRSGGEARSQQHQFIRERRAADERYVAVEHSRKQIARLLDELCGGPIGCDHDHGLDRHPLQPQLIDGIVDIHGVSLVVHSQDAGVAEALRTKRFCDTRIAGVAAGILLGENRDLLREYPFHLDEIAHRGVGFLHIARPIVEHIAIRRIVADDIRAGEGAEEQRPVLQRIRHRHRGGCGADISDKAEHLVFLVKLLHGVEGARRFETVVSGDQFEQPAMHAAGVVDPAEGRVDTELHLAPELSCRAGKRPHNSKPYFPVGNAANRWADGAAARGRGGGG
jgi:MHS family proline/betaine transporter-like MFS transporter